jgi:hypothetical protein
MPKQSPSANHSKQIKNFTSRLLQHFCTSFGAVVILLCGYQRSMRIPCHFSCPAAFYVPAARKARHYAPLLRAYALHFAASTHLYRLQRLNFSSAAHISFKYKFITLNFNFFFS